MLLKQSPTEVEVELSGLEAIIDDGEDDVDDDVGDGCCRKISNDGIK